MAKRYSECHVFLWNIFMIKTAKPVALRPCNSVTNFNLPTIKRTRNASCRTWFKILIELLFSNRSRRFNLANIKVHQWTCSWASPTHHRVSIDLQSGRFPRNLTIKTLYAFLVSYGLAKFQAHRSFPVVITVTTRHQFRTTDYYVISSAVHLLHPS